MTSTKKMNGLAKDIPSDGGQIVRFLLPGLMGTRERGYCRDYRICIVSTANHHTNDK